MALVCAPVGFLLVGVTDCHLKRLIESGYVFSQMEWSRVIDYNGFKLISSCNGTHGSNGMKKICQKQRMFSMHLRLCICE